MTEKYYPKPKTQACKLIMECKGVSGNTESEFWKKDGAKHVLLVQISIFPPRSKQYGKFMVTVSKAAPICEVCDNYKQARDLAISYIKKYFGIDYSETARFLAE